MALKKKARKKKRPARTSPRKTRKVHAPVKFEVKAPVRRNPAKKARKKVVRRKKSLPTTYFHPQTFLKKRARRAAVLGMGRSGLAAARLLRNKGFAVRLSDSRPRRELRAAAAKLPAGVQWEGGGHSDLLLRCHFAVKSPGILPSAPILAKFREAGIPVFSELEIALAFCPTAEIIAVTGTNGKTTTAALTHHLFKSARRKTHLFGNVGVPLSAGVSKIKKKDTLVLEVSSYQLEDSRWFRPVSAAILNLTSDHIEHHGSMEAYRKAKTRIFAYQDRDHSCIFNSADPAVVGMARNCRARKLFFGHDPSTRTAAWMEKGRIVVRMPGEKKTTSLVPPKLPGVHTLENSMAAVLLALTRGIAPKAVQKGLKTFKGVEHRIENCGKLGPLVCVNDSKATNIDSTLAALRSLNGKHEGKVILILGGLGKSGGFGALRSLVEKFAKAVLTIGSAAAKIEEDLQGATHVFPCENLETAVDVALKIGAKGETLLLSPACASFDQFASFEERGRRFKELVKKAGGKS
ncbi:MAG: UDP-N-acetylmuramoyl-L-alanine--D-glutamate ligase [Elusimicrobiota bacterium]